MNCEAYLDENGTWIAYTESQVFDILSKIGTDIKNGDGKWRKINNILKDRLGGEGD